VVTPGAAGVTPNDERLVFLALAELFEMVVAIQPHGIYPKRWIYDELMKAAGSPSFLGKDA
jgi:hypothetical protein